MVTRVFHGLIYSLIIAISITGLIGSRNAGARLIEPENTFKKWPGVVDAAWAYEQVLFIYVFDNGHERSDMATAMCKTLREEIGIIYPVLIYIVDIVEVAKEDRSNVKLGQARCNTSPPVYRPAD